MVIPGLYKVKVFIKNGYNVIIFVNDVINKILSRDSNYIVDVWPLDQSLVTVAFV